MREALFAAGAPFGLTAVGSKAPTPATFESGWLDTQLDVDAAIARLVGPMRFRRVVLDQPLDPG